MVRRVDNNQREITEILRDLGCSVQILSEVGKGCPDLALGYRGKNYLIELKDGNKPPSQRKLTPDEQKFFDNWRGQVCIIKSVAEATDFIMCKNYASLQNVVYYSNFALISQFCSTFPQKMWITFDKYSRKSHCLTYDRMINLA